ncbi:MAG: hypothetical protein IJ581_06930 [Paludibacteraceae bacterium]|nr:hypothetical protein [Paludibacteraceae bacterium]
MTKLLAIEPDGSQLNDIVYNVNVIANDQENILILRDVINDNGENAGIECKKVILAYNRQYCYEPLPELSISGRLIVTYKDKDDDIITCMDNIAKLILRFIQ